MDLSAKTPDKLTPEMKAKMYPKIGNRDIVGPSFSVHYDYHDTPDIPMPSVRWGANTPEVLALRKKEQGDWAALSLEDKKKLYRASFRQTFAEMNAPTGDWKRIASFICYTLALSTFIFVYNVTYYGTPAATLTKEKQQEMVATMLAHNVGPIAGLSSKYDFDKNEWKK